MTLHITQFEGGSALSSFRIQQLLPGLQAIHDKIYALSMVQPFDAAAGGFAVALVNTLQIGIANLPKMEADE